MGHTHYWRVRTEAKGVEDARGRRFLLERWKEDDSGLGEWLRARERMDREGLFPWPFRGPYRVLEEVHLPQE